MTRLKDGEAAVAMAEGPVSREDGRVICGVDVSRLVPYTTEAELPAPVYRIKEIKGKKIEQLVKKGEPRYYTQQNGTEMIEVRRGFHRVERRFFCKIRVRDPQWKPFIEAIRKRGITEVY